MTKDKCRSVCGLVLLAAIGLLALPAAGHHARPVHYNPEQVVEISGTIAQSVLQNPHSRLIVEMDLAEGGVRRFLVELVGVSTLDGQQFPSDMLAPGRRITLVGPVHRRHEDMFYAEQYQLEDGRSGSFR